MRQADVRDPVCGMEVTPENAAGSYQYKDQQFYFCNPSCLERFKANPEHFLAPPAGLVQLPAAADHRIYTCPMDPEVRHVGPGACPGAAWRLSRTHHRAEEEANPELRT